MSVLRYVHILSFGQEGKAFFNNSDSDVTRRETISFVSSKAGARRKAGVGQGMSHLREQSAHIILRLLGVI